MNNPNISIVVPTYNSACTILKTIQALLAQDYPKENTEIIVVDDGSTDNTRELIKGYPVKYFFQSNAGPAAARNLGWRNSSGEIILFTDSDCIPDTNWASKLVANYADYRTGAVGGSYGIKNKENLLADCIFQEISIRHEMMPRKVKALGSYNLSVRVDILRSIGGFDESYTIASGEDNDLSYRILKAGYTLVFSKDAIVLHYHPQRLLSYLKTQFWHGYWRMKLYKDHSDMMGGDDYSGLLDYMQPILSVLILTFFLFRGVLFLKIILICLFITEIVLQFPFAYKIVSKTKKRKYFILCFFTFLRGFARGLGMVVGVFRFLAFQKKS